MDGGLDLTTIAQMEGQPGQPTRLATDGETLFWYESCYPWSNEMPASGPIGYYPVLTSRDLATWTDGRIDGRLDGHDACPTDMAVVGNRAVAVGKEWIAESGELMAAAWTSDDGVAWTPTTRAFPDSGGLVQVIAGTHGFVSFAPSDWQYNEPPIWTSSDGRDWTRLRFPFHVRPDEISLSYSGGLYLIPVHGDQLLVSPDLTSWTKVTETGLNEIGPIVALPGGFVALGNAGGVAPGANPRPFLAISDGQAEHWRAVSVDMHRLSVDTVGPLVYFGDRLAVLAETMAPNRGTVYLVLIDRAALEP
jgi:hypothetical protein